MNTMSITMLTFAADYSVSKVCGDRFVHVQGPQLVCLGMRVRKVAKVAQKANLHAAVGVD